MRYWAALTSSELKFWNAPEDEHCKKVCEELTNTILGIGPIELYHTGCSGGDRFVHSRKGRHCAGGDRCGLLSSLVHSRNAYPYGSQIQGHGSIQVSILMMQNQILAERPFSYF